MSFPAYEEYCKSAVDWIESIPKHWEIVALKRIANLKSGDGITSDSIEETGKYPVFGGNGLRGYTDKFTHDGDYVVIGRQGALCGNINYAHGKFWASEHAVVATPLKQVSTVWLGEMLRAMNLNQYSVSAAQPGLSMELVGNLRSILPPLEEQEAIAKFLDAETSKIDALVAEQRRLIELLAEKRQAVISHAVTKGLDPHVRMKPSGIEWLGDVPEHWEVSRLKHATSRIVDCPHDTPIYTEDGDHLVIRTSDLDYGKLFPEIMKRVDYAQYEYRIRREPVLENDIVYSREGGRWGHAALVPEGERFCLGQRMMQFRVNDKFDCQYLMWHLNSQNVYRQGDVDTVGAASPHVNVGTICNYRIAKPSRAEQQEIVEYIRDQIGEFDSLEVEAHRAITLLQERRTALISAAVTGKIDVRARQH